MDFIIPTDELKELAELLDSGKLESLRDKCEEGRRTKVMLSKYTSRIWFFPFGARPNLKHPIEVFYNGMAQWMNHEVKLVRVGQKKPITVVVFLQETKEGDLVQATYMILPSEKH